MGPHSEDGEGLALVRLPRKRVQTLLHAGCHLFVLVRLVAGASRGCAALLQPALRGRGHLLRFFVLVLGVFVSVPGHDGDAPVSLVVVLRRGEQWLGRGVHPHLNCSGGNGDIRVPGRVKQASKVVEENAWETRSHITRLPTQGCREKSLTVHKRCHVG